MSVIYMTNSDSICEGLMKNGMSEIEINETVDNLYCDLELGIVAGAWLNDDGDQIFADEVFAEWINEEYGVIMLKIDLHSKNKVDNCRNKSIGL